MSRRRIWSKVVIILGTLVFVCAIVFVGIFLSKMEKNVPINSLQGGISVSAGAGINGEIVGSVAGSKHGDELFGKKLDVSTSTKIFSKVNAENIKEWKNLDLEFEDGNEIEITITITNNHTVSDRIIKVDFVDELDKDGVSDIENLSVVRMVNDKGVDKLTSLEINPSNSVTIKIRFNLENKQKSIKVSEWGGLQMDLSTDAVLTINEWKTQGYLIESFTDETGKSSYYFVSAGEGKQNTISGTVVIPNKVALVDESGNALLGEDGKPVTGNVTKVGNDKDGNENRGFRKCENITSVVISEGITSIELAGFQDCTSLKSVTIPSTVTNIAEGAFLGCKNLEKIILAKNSQLKTIGYRAFKNCKLTSITIPATVTEIGGEAFWGCTSLTTVAFAEDNQLQVMGEDYKISEDVYKTISSIFSGCDKLTSITGLANTKWLVNNNVVEFISDAVVLNYLKDDTYKNYKWTRIIEHTESGLIYTCNSLEGTASVKASSLLTGAVEIPETITVMKKTYTVTSLEASAFSGCGAVTSITIPASVKTIGEYAFEGCGELSSITFAQNSKLTALKAYTFKNCVSLVSITVPANVNSILANAFADSSFSYIAFENMTGWEYDETSVEVNDAEYNAIVLLGDGVEYDWTRKSEQ